MSSFQVIRRQQVISRLRESERAWMYAQLGMPASKIAKKVGMNAQRVRILLRGRQKDAETLDKLNGYMSKFDPESWPPSDN
jgi:predicted transcriptional regulator